MTPPAPDLLPHHDRRSALRAKPRPAAHLPPPRPRTPRGRPVRPGAGQHGVARDHPGVGFAGVAAHAGAAVRGASGGDGRAGLEGGSVTDDIELAAGQVWVTTVNGRVRQREIWSINKRVSFGAPGETVGGLATKAAFRDWIRRHRATLASPQPAGEEG